MDKSIGKVCILTPIYATIENLRETSLIRALKSILILGHDDFVWIIVASHLQHLKMRLGI